MRVRIRSESSVSGKALSKSTIIMGSLSTVVVFAGASTGAASFHMNEQYSASESAETRTEYDVDVDSATLQTEAVISPVSEPVVSEIVSRSADGTSETREYRRTTQDIEGNTTTQQQTYTTTVDGGSAIDIDLQSTSSSSGSVSSNSSVRMNTQSSSIVRSSP